MGRLNRNQINKFLLFISIGLCLVFYTNMTSVSRNKIGFEFGPSPRSNDYHVMFNSINKPKWDQLPDQLKWFNFHQLSYLRKVGLPSGGGDSARLNVTNNAYLNGDEALKAAQVMKEQNFNVSVTVSNGLSYGNVCRDYIDATTAAIAAANFEYNQLETLRKALAYKGKKIDRIYVDGPFLRVLQNAKKEYSCATFNHNGLNQVLLGSGRLPSGQNGAVKVVHEYLKELKRLFPDAQLFLTLNIVNWKQHNLLPYFGTEDYLFEDIFELYLSEFYKDGADYKINGLQFDAPYSVVSLNFAAFKQRIKYVYEQLNRNVSNIDNMGFSFYVNSEDHYNFDNRIKNRGFFQFRSEKNNKYSSLISQSDVCNYELDLNQRQKCFISDPRYFQDSRLYANELIKMITNDPVLNSMKLVYFTYGSWHVSPSKSIWGTSSYMDFITKEITRVLNY